MRASAQCFTGDFVSFPAILRSVQLAVYTYSFVLHALSDEKNTEKSRFCAFFC